MEAFFSQYLRSYAKALKDLRAFKDDVPAVEEKSDFMKKWDRARGRILSPYGLIERLIMISCTDVKDMRMLEESRPHEIVKYFISRMLKMN